MSKEKQTENSHWKNRLQDLDDLQDADAALNKQYAWERLHDRLHKKQDRKKAIWYWAAAALLLLMVLPLIKKMNRDTVSKDIVQKKTETKTVTPSHPAEPAIITDKKEPAVIVSAPVIKKIHERSTHIHKAEWQKKIYTATMDTLVIAENKISGNALQETIAPTTDSSIAKLTAVPLKRKLTVVHINELDKHDQENERLATHAQWPVFQVKFLNPDNNTSSLPASNTKQDMLQIKIPIKN